MHNACDTFPCRANLQKMKARSRGRFIQQQVSEHRPNFKQANRDDDPVTPCTSGRAPDQTGRLKRWAPPKKGGKQQLCSHHRDSNSPTLFQLLMPQWLSIAFSQDKVSQRKAKRNRQSWFLRSWTLSCLSTSQVYSKGVRYFKAKYCNKQKKWVLSFLCLFCMSLFRKDQES